jgi:hypothetical protein
MTATPSVDRAAASHLVAVLEQPGCVQAHARRPRPQRPSRLWGWLPSATSSCRPRSLSWTGTCTAWSPRPPRSCWPLRGLPPTSRRRCWWPPGTIPSASTARPPALGPTHLRLCRPADPGGQTTPEIIRCLKRHLAREIYRALTVAAPISLQPAAPHLTAAG